MSPTPCTTSKPNHPPLQLRCGAPRQQLPVWDYRHPNAQVVKSVPSWARCVPCEKYGLLQQQSCFSAETLACFHPHSFACKLRALVQSTVSLSGVIQLNCPEKFKRPSAQKQLSRGQNYITISSASAILSMRKEVAISDRQTKSPIPHLPHFKRNRGLKCFHRHPHPTVSLKGPSQHFVQLIWPALYLGSP